MIEINLLNRSGIYSKGDNSFNKVDETLISEISVDFKKDFESIHKTNKVQIKTGKNRIFTYCFLIICIVSVAFYYQFYVNTKTIIESEKVKGLLGYIVEDEDLSLSNFKYSDYSISLKIQVSSEFYQNKKINLRSHLNSIASSDSYSLEILNDGNADVLLIRFPAFLEIINSDKSLQGHNSLGGMESISHDSLLVAIDNLFNSSDISDFEVSKIENSSLYNLVFPK